MAEHGTNPASLPPRRRGGSRRPPVRKPNPDAFDTLGRKRSSPARRRAIRRPEPSPEGIRTSFEILDVVMALRRGLRRAARNGGTAR